MMGLSVIAGLTLATLASGTAVAAPARDPLAGLEGRSRVLAVVAPTASDPRLLAQRELFSAMRAGARERDLVLVEGIGQTEAARRLRERFGIALPEFRAVLVGKDGGDKLSSSEPIGAGRLFPLIDSMPMRQDEMRRAQP